MNQRVVALMRSAFEDSDLDRAELARRSGVPAGTLSNLFTGNRPVYVEQLIAIARALGADPGAWLNELAEEGDELAERRSRRLSEAAPTVKRPRVAKKSQEQAGASEDEE